MPDFDSLRSAMVERQLRRRAIGDERVLAAIGAVPRELFVPSSMRRRAYADSALPIGEGQTISQPWIVAAICQALELGGEDRVLEVGTGSGYSACVLSCLAASVSSVERRPKLAQGARRAIEELGVENVEIVVGDGSRGLPGQSPFAAIAVHASAPGPPRTLLEQLGDGGRLVVPISVGPTADVLTLFRRRGDALERVEISSCRFVPLLGAEGFASPDAQQLSGGGSKPATSG